MTVKEQCLEKIQGYIDDCDEYKDTEHRYAALVLSIVKRDIELDIEESAAAPTRYISATALGRHLCQILVRIAPHIQQTAVMVYVTALLGYQRLLVEEIE